MRILFDATAIPTQLTGVGHYVMSLLPRLAEIDTVDVVVAVRSTEAERYRRLSPTLRVVDVDLGARLSRIAWEQTGLVGLARKERIDVIHSPHYTMAYLARRPCVVVFHDGTFVTAPELHERVKVEFFRRAMRLSGRRAARIVAVSETTRQALTAELAIPERRIDVVPHGVDVDEFSKPTAGNVSETLGKYSISKRYIVFVGTIEPRKNLPRLIEAYRRLNAEGLAGVDLVLAGKRGWHGEQFENALSSLPARIRRGVRVLGFVPDADRAALLRGAAVFCYPSLAEGFGMPVLEAMAAGAPVITSDVSATAEVAGEAAELCDPRSVDAIAGALRNVLCDTATADRLRAAGRKRVEHFTWSRAAKLTVESYRRALDE